MNLYYVYKFLDYKDSLLYIGKTTTSLEYRFSQHFNNGHLSKDVYNQVNKILYSECLNRDDMSIKERYLVCNLNPKYNTEYNNDGKLNFIIDDFNWKEFELSKIEENFKSRKKQGVINTSDEENSRYIDHHGYINVEHNNCTPRYYGCGTFSRQHVPEKIYYYIIDEVIYTTLYPIGLDARYVSGLPVEYRKKLIRCYGADKNDFITLKDKTKLNSSSFKKILIKLSSVPAILETQIDFLKAKNKDTDYLSLILEKNNELDSYLKYKKVA